MHQGIRTSADVIQWTLIWWTLPFKVFSNNQSVSLYKMGFGFLLALSLHFSLVFFYGRLSLNCERICQTVITCRRLYCFSSWFYFSATFRFPEVALPATEKTACCPAVIRQAENYWYSKSLLSHIVCPSCVSQGLFSRQARLVIKASFLWTKGNSPCITMRHLSWHMDHVKCHETFKKWEAHQCSECSVWARYLNFHSNLDGQQAGHRAMAWL